MSTGSEQALGTKTFDVDASQLPSCGNDDCNCAKTSPGSTLLSLPPELLEIILENVNLDVSDIVSVGLSCRQLYPVVFHNKKLWKNKVLLWKHAKRLRRLMVPFCIIVNEIMCSMSLEMACSTSCCDSSENSDSDYETISWCSKSTDSSDDLSDCFLE